MRSPTLKRPIALGYVDAEHMNHKEVEVIIRDKVFKGQLCKKKFLHKRNSQN